MSAPTARTIRRALDVLEQLPPEALGVLAEAIIDRLDLIERDCDAEPEEDCCSANDDDLATSPAYLFARGNLPGDDDDAEEDDPQGDTQHDPDIEDDATGQPGWMLGADPVTGPALCGEVRL